MELHELRIEDVAGASLTLIGVLIESYVTEGYCDPTMYRALSAAQDLTHRLKEIAMESNQNGLILEVDSLLVNLQVMTMEAGQVIEDIINEHGLPVDPRTFIPFDSDGENG